MKLKQLPLLLGLFPLFLAGQTKIVKGMVTDGVGPLENVNVIIKENGEGTRTDKNGQYQIQVDQGETLVFSYVGKKTVAVVIEDVTRTLNMELYTDLNALDEVTVTEQKPLLKSQQQLFKEYNTNKELIKTKFGIFDKKTFGYPIRIVDGEDIGVEGFDFASTLSIIAPNIQFAKDNNNRIIAAFSRRNQSSSLSVEGPNPLVYEVDGLIYTEVPNWIDLANIERVAVVESLGGVARYGGIANGGIVIINTKSANFSPDSTSPDTPDSLRLRNNFVAPGNLRDTKVQPRPSYLIELESAVNFVEASAIFNKLENTYQSSPFFYLDAYHHFSEKWNKTKFADGIIEENFKQFENNAVLLKALAYIYESQGRLEKANEMYKETFILRPSYAQSYLDMARSYRNLEEPRRAASMFARYNYLLEEGFMEEDVVGFGPIMKREFNNLLAFEHQAVAEGRRARKLVKEDFEGTRLVFEWNDSEAEFDLQFANPEGQYHTWKHSMEENAEAILLEKNIGYSCSEYVMDDSMPGIWTVNINYLGNKSLTPTYLKVTIYGNYGLRSQNKTIKVFKLSLKNVNQKLLSLNIDNLGTPYTLE